MKKTIIAVLTLFLIMLGCKHDSVDTSIIFITGVNVTVTKTTAQISFNTTLPSLATLNLNGTTYQTTGVTHLVNVSDLTPGNLYSFQIQAIVPPTSKVWHETGWHYDTFSTENIVAMEITNASETHTLTTATITWETNLTADCVLTINGQNYSSSGTSHSVNITGLSAGQTYIYNINAKEAVFGGLYTNEINFQGSVKTGDMAEVQITNISYTADQLSATISWETSQDTTCTLLINNITYQTTGLTHSVVVPNLVPETDYNYSIIASYEVEGVTNTSSHNGILTTANYSVGALSNIQFAQQYVIPKTVVSCTTSVNSNVELYFRILGDTEWTKQYFTSTDNLNHNIIVDATPGQQIEYKLKMLPQNPAYQSIESGIQILNFPEIHLVEVVRQMDMVNDEDYSIYRRNTNAFAIERYMIRGRFDDPLWYMSYALRKPDHTWYSFGEFLWNDWHEEVFWMYHNQMGDPAQMYTFLPPTGGDIVANEIMAVGYKSTTDEPVMLVHWHYNIGRDYEYIVGNSSRFTINRPPYETVNDIFLRGPSNFGVFEKANGDLVIVGYFQYDYNGSIGGDEYKVCYWVNENYTVIDTSAAFDKIKPIGGVWWNDRIYLFGMIVGSTDLVVWDSVSNSGNVVTWNQFGDSDLQSFIHEHQQGIQVVNGDMYMYGFTEYTYGYGGRSFLVKNLVEQTLPSWFVDYRVQITNIFELNGDIYLLVEMLKYPNQNLSGLVWRIINTRTWQMEDIGEFSTDIQRTLILVK